MDPLVSVIIPVYKVEKYLCKCIDSILHQTYRNLEIILVDDGSPDQCGKICDQYADNDIRIHVIHEENGGLSQARNAALDICKGNYVTFVDSDDWVTEDYVEFLLNLLLSNDADISICNPRFVYESDIKNKRKWIPPKKEKVSLMDPEKALETMLYQKEFGPYAWAKMYKRELFHEIRYPKGRLFEDLGTTHKLFLTGKRIAYSSREKYFYLQRKDSIMRSDFDIRKMDNIDFTEQIFYEVSAAYPALKKAAGNFLFSASLHTLILIPDRKGDYASEKKRISEIIIKFRKEILLDKKARLKNRIAALSIYLGIFNIIKRFNYGW